MTEGGVSSGKREVYPQFTAAGFDKFMGGLGVNKTRFDLKDVNKRMEELSVTQDKTSLINSTRDKASFIVADQSIARLDSKTTELKLRDGAKDLEGAALGTALSIGFCWATSALAALQLIPFVQFFVSIVQMVTTILCAGSIILTICALAD